MAFPHWLTRVNRRVTNRVLGRLVGKIPNLATLHHEGRKSGTLYQTPILAFPLDGTVVIALTYGADVDWLKNVMSADHCTVVAANRELALTSPRIVHGADLPAALPVPFRVFLRVLRVDTYVLLSQRS